MFQTKKLYQLIKNYILSRYSAVSLTRIIFCTKIPQGLVVKKGCNTLYLLRIYPEPFKKAKRNSGHFYCFILSFNWLKITSLQNKQKILGIAEPFTVFHANMDGHSKSYKIFRAFCYLFFLRTRRKDKGVYVRMERTKIKIFKREDEFFQEKMEEICAQEKLSVEEVICLSLNLFVFSVIVCCQLAFIIKKQLLSLQ